MSCYQVLKIYAVHQRKLLKLTAFSEIFLWTMNEQQTTYILLKKLYVSYHTF